MMHPTYIHDRSAERCNICTIQSREIDDNIFSDGIDYIYTPLLRRPIPPPILYNSFRQIPPQNMSFAPQNMPFGPQNMPFGPQNMSFGPQNMPFGPQNMSFGPQNMSFGPQNNRSFNNRSFSASPGSPPRREPLRSVSRKKKKKERCC
eukprot:GHVL01045102.1.p1 GENE.GHVL01045102.1~~GHVL01045102.1.p1  ORF type:complete len:148 (+),score=32.83 GHVL01045102.1:36-479(+)